MKSRRYFVELGVAIGVYAVVLLGAVSFLNAYPDSPWRVPLALAPMVPAVFALIAIMRQFDRMDELQRRIQFEALAFAFGGTALLTFGYGFLQLTGFPQVSWFFVWPIMAVLWMTGKARADRRYK